MVFLHTKSSSPLMHLMVYHFVSQKAIAKVSRSGSNIIDCDFKNDNTCSITMSMMDKTQEIVFEISIN